VKLNHKPQQDGSLTAPDIKALCRLAYGGKNILVTGAGGSIGRRIIADLAQYAPLKMAALDRDENAIYELEQEIRLNRLPVRVESHIADVRDAGRLGGICQTFSPQVVFHAAAYKHVPLTEAHPSEAVLSNVLGTMNLLDVVGGFGTERFVFLSTNDAVNPAGIMGATKRIGEMLVCAAAKSGRFRAASVRLGNVLGSSSSVVAVFQRQIAAGGPVTVTHSDMVRSFITMKQATELILSAGSVAQNGETYLSEMGRPRNIQELAREMIFLSGSQGGNAIEIEIIGLRPGEKFAEELKTLHEVRGKSRFENLSYIEPHALDERTLMGHIARLIQSARNEDRNGVYAVLSGMGLGFKQIRPSAVDCPPASALRVEEGPLSQRPSSLENSTRLSKGAVAGK
jgi:FlaA1/EpsC-like NDP-sugar epimerase